MTSPGISDFLLARIAEDEASDGWHTVDCGVDLGYWATGVCTCGYPARVLAECEAKRQIVERESRSPHQAGEWTPDCGGDWCLNVGALSHEPGLGAFANYWPDNTVSASVYIDGEQVAESGIVTRASRADCQAFAEQWIRSHLSDASPVLRLFALPYADHPDYREEWRL